MVRTIATLLVLLQLRPVALALMDCATRVHPAAACEMAMQPANAATHHGASHHGAPAGPLAPMCDCPSAALCGAGVALPPPFTAGIGGVDLTRDAVLASPLNSARTADPAAPPVPPPNA